MLRGPTHTLGRRRPSPRWPIILGHCFCLQKYSLISSSPSNIFDLNVLVYQQNFEILCSFTKKIIYCPSELCGGFSGTTLVCVCVLLPPSHCCIALAFPRRPGPDKQYSNSKRALVRLRARAHVCICRPAGTPTQYHHHCTHDHPLVVAVSKKKRPDRR